MKPNCNGICLTSGDLGFPGYGIAIAHPECPEHGDLAAYEVDGSPRGVLPDEA